MRHDRMLCCAWGALCLMGIAVAGTSPPEVWADPCGMVPPVQVADADNLPIKRVGAQKTYVFYKNGLETFIIRPGYEGRVDEFGMQSRSPNRRRSAKHQTMCLSKSPTRLIRRRLSSI